MRRIGIVIVLIVFFSIGGTAGAICPGQELPRILISNDDGIDAPGLEALCDALSLLGTVTVAAPAQGRSGAGHGITTDIPILVRESVRKGSRWYGIEALPASCVRLALENLLEERPAIVVSGINRGENLGVVTFYSATVACAREAAFKGIPAIAISLQNGPAMDYGPAARIAARLVRECLAGTWPAGIYLNVNVPNRPENTIRGIRVVAQDLRASRELFEELPSPAGTRTFRPSYIPLDPGTTATDVWAVGNGFVSITPFQIDQTDRPALGRFVQLERLSGKDKD
jgi:5'-nucleotidase